MHGKVQRWGNSLGLRIPRAVAEQTGVTYGSEVEISVVDGSLLVRPTRRKRIPLDELLRGVNERNRHDEVEWGPPVGREAW